MFLIVYLIFCLVIAAIATSRGRTGIGWFFIAILISPLISIIILLVLPEAGHLGPVRHQGLQGHDLHVDGEHVQEGQELAEGARETFAAAEIGRRALQCS